MCTARALFVDVPLNQETNSADICSAAKNEGIQAEREGRAIPEMMDYATWLQKILATAQVQTYKQLSSQMVVDLYLVTLSFLVRRCKIREIIEQF